MHSSVAANLLAAAGVAIADRIQDPTLSSSAAAALLTIAEWQPIGAQELAGVVGLSQSATVRLVDELVGAGLARRLDKKGRAVPLALTAAGKRRAQSLQARRLATAEQALASLAPEDRAALEKALPALLAGLTTGRVCARHLCRFCDFATCRAGPCPVAAAATAIDGPFVRPTL